MTFRRVYSSKCISQEKCNACKNVCPVDGALCFEDGKLVKINRDICTNCMKCYQACPSDAIKAWGKEMTVDECMEIILKDRGYYEKSLSSFVFLSHSSLFAEYSGT